MKHTKSGSLQKTWYPRFVILLPLLLLLALPFVKQDELKQWLPPAFQSSLPSKLQDYFRTTAGVDDSLNEVQKLDLHQVLKACETHQYTSEIISLDPLVIYINNFTSAQEAEELINIGSPEFTESFISRSGTNQRVSGRTSSSAPLSMESPLVACMLRRARRFMGSMMLPHEPFSVPQVVRYFPGQKYDLHTDFWPQHQVLNDGSGRLFNRVASFFVFLRDNCTQGYTYFPRVEPTYDSPETPVDLDALYHGKIGRGELDGEEKGVKFKPIQGNAIFWVNIDAQGTGDRRLIHAGLPVGEGEKIGLNIWPRKFYGRVDGREDGEERQRKGWSGKWKE
ncbi:hypothetical protein ACN47E_002992 [Coniothyrium glycines]